MARLSQNSRGDVRRHVPSRIRRSSTILAALAAVGAVSLAFAAVQGASFVLPSTVGAYSSTRATRPSFWSSTSRSSGQTALLAEGLETEAGVAEVAEVADAAAAVPEVAAIAPLFQEFNVSMNTDPKKLMKVMVAIFNKGERALDLILTDPRAKSTLLYSIAMLPDNFRAAAQILTRRRDRRMRVRVLQHFRPIPDADMEVLRMSKTTNVTKLGSAITSKFVDVAGNNLKRSVKLEFAGREIAFNAMMAIETASQKANRELTFSPRFVKQALDAVSSESIAPSEGEQSGSAANGTSSTGNPNIQVSLVVVLVAT
ncbi:unnamed protein product [Polarella glacialis]|uniref:Uncharacterized protein n=1 Tax=Polarella glacialis TaxID=89957 RepID=A0A813LND8_POLGL|nr:unnamed protein product [Polarella glacialis]